SSWELSAARAAACLRYIISRGEVDVNRLKAVGYADSKPFRPSNTAENRDANRRVEFFFIPRHSEGW
ncbi:MAG: OmpA family protein, partial [Okeania sp. SIO3C4]|nr:OmpA family protein [Okeania sp. SIO3C4]